MGFPKSGLFEGFIRKHTDGRRWRWRANKGVWQIKADVKDEADLVGDTGSTGPQGIQGPPGPAGEGGKVVMAGYNNSHNRTAYSWQGITFNWFETPVNTEYLTVSGNRVTFKKTGAYAVNYFAMSHDNNRYYAHHRISGAVYHHTHSYGYQWQDHNFNLAHKFNAGEYVDFHVYKNGNSNSYTWHSGGTYSMVTITYLGEG